ncbi:MAG: hypothetical protein ACRYFB_09680 [Janthinobacterium lividum]
MNWPFINLKKALLSCVMMFSVLYCAAQKPLLIYQDLQFLIQSNSTAVTTFLQQKDYHLQSSSNGEIRFFGLFADELYNDIFIGTQGRKTTVILTTTNLSQIETIQKELQSYSSRNSKNGKLYRIKDLGISTLSIKEPNSSTDKTYTIQFEN